MGTPANELVVDRIDRLMIDLSAAIADYNRLTGKTWEARVIGRSAILLRLGAEPFPTPVLHRMSINELVAAYDGVRNMVEVAAGSSNQPRCDDNESGRFFDDACNALNDLRDRIIYEVKSRTNLDKNDAYERALLVLRDLAYAAASIEDIATYAAAEAAA